jgi:sugar lactone lactonase YvrE|tara:strand:- start:19 stop:1251 length:1233 start_codon:yes stop_codon:yes gene_type:complete
MKIIHFIGIALFLLFFTSGGNKKQDNIDLTEIIVPLGIIPDTQNGYGSGPDQLAQPDDVELLPDGSMIISDVDNNRIQHFSSAGTLFKSITAHDMGLTNEEIIPTGIAKDGEGFIYVSLEGAGHVARFTPNLVFDQFIGQPGNISAEDYYNPENDGILLKPQGLIVAANGDIYVIDMAKKVFKKNGVRNFGFRKFKQVKINGAVSYIYDRDFAATQEITKVMRKSEGMTICPDQKTLFVAEEKPMQSQFGNVNKKRYIAAFDLETGRFLNQLIGVTMKNDSIIDGYFNDSVEGLCTYGDNLFSVDEKAGKFYIFDIRSGECRGFIGKRAYYYCDDHSDCVIEGINYNEQTIIAGVAAPHLKNDWQKNELASPDGLSAIELFDGTKRLSIVDQWNSRIVVYDLDQVLQSIE